MERRAPPPDPTLLLASLGASSVGTWDYDVLADRFRYSRTFAALYGLPPDEGTRGVSMDRIVAATHPADRPQSLAKRMQMFQHGGAFVLEYRVLPSPLTVNWVLLRGFYERDAAGRVTHGRGIAVDVTEGKREGYAEGEVLFVTEADDRTISALDRATKHVLAARRALAELGSEGEARLRPAADALLMEIAHHLAAGIVPVLPSRTEH